MVVRTTLLYALFNAGFVSRTATRNYMELRLRKLFILLYSNFLTEPCNVIILPQIHVMLDQKFLEAQRFSKTIKKLIEFKHDCIYRHVLVRFFKSQDVSVFLKISTRNAFKSREIAQSNGHIQTCICFFDASILLLMLLRRSNNIEFRRIYIERNLCGIF